LFKKKTPSITMAAIAQKSSDSILDGCNLDFSKITFGKPKPHAAGGKIIPMIHVDTNRDLQFTAPLMFTWGASESIDIKTQLPNGKWSTQLQAPGAEYPNQKASSFFDNMGKLEKMVHEHALVHSQEWLGKETKLMEVVENAFGPMVKYPKFKGTDTVNYDGPPTLSLKIPLHKKGYITEVWDYDSREKLFDPKAAEEGTTPMQYIGRTQMSSLIQSGAIWVIGKQIYITFNLLKGVIKPPSGAQVVEGTDWMHDDEEESKGAKKEPASASVALVDDSDGEGDAPAPAPVPTPAPAPAPVVAAPAKRPAAEVTDGDEKPAVAVKKPKLVKKKPAVAAPP
jgi:hypothetical protein